MCQSSASHDNQILDQIVSAVNAHDDLLAACRLVLPYVQELAAQSILDGQTSGSDIDERRKVLEAAIAKAEKERANV